MRNPFKTKMYPSPKQRSEPVFASADPRLVQNAKNDLENLTRKPAFTAEEK